MKKIIIIIAYLVVLVKMRQKRKLQHYYNEEKALKELEYRIKSQRVFAPIKEYLDEQ